MAKLSDYVDQGSSTSEIKLLDSITTSATATYALTKGGVAYSPDSARNLIVSLNGITQAPQGAYTVSGSNIVFDSALTSADVIDYILVIGSAISIGTPSDGTVGTAQMNYPLGNFSSTGIDDNADATAITINSSEQVGIGTASPAHKLQVNASAFDGVQFQSAGSDCGYIGVNANQLYVGAGAQLLLQTGNAGATDGSTRLRVDSDGIKFGSDAAAANALDDYEEGTWTPVLTGHGGTNPTVSYGNQTGYYTKVGNIVTASWYSGTLNISNAGSGYAYISGLPYSSSTAVHHYPVCKVTFNTSTQHTCDGGYLYDQTMRLMRSGLSSTLTSWTSGSSQYLMIGAVYRTA